MDKITLKIASPIIITGVFSMIVFIALNYGKLPNEVYFVFLFLSIYVFLFGFAIGQNFSYPVKKLLKRATELSQGDLKTRVYLETKDELGELSKVFNKIAQDLEESKSANVMEKEATDIKVKARTQSLEETISALEQKIRNRTVELDKVIKEIERTREITKTKDEEIAKLKIEINELNNKLLLIATEKPKKTITKKTKIEPVIPAKEEIQSETQASDNALDSKSSLE